MKSIQGFWNDLTSTFYNPAFYAEIPKKPAGNAVFFLLLVSIVSAFAAGIFVVSGVAASVKSFTVNDFVSKNYPETLVVTIKDGKASVNQPEPYMIPVTEGVKDKEHSYDNFLVIDTRPETTLEMLNSYNSFAVLTRDRIFLAPEDKDGRVFPLTSVKDFTVDKASAVSWTQKFLGILWVIAIPLALFLILMLGVFSLVYHLVASLLGALIAMLVGMIRKNKLAYGDAYKVALYASAPVIIVQTILMFFHIPILPYYLDVILFIVVLSANIAPKAGISASGVE